MRIEDLRELCARLELGALTGPPRQVFGGLLHEMYRAETDAGTYAVKALNPLIMKRPTAIRNYLFSEKAARLVARAGIPAALAIGAESCLHQVGGSYFMVFAWVPGQSLPPEQVTCAHCGVIGGLLARLHNVDFSSIWEQPEAGIPTRTDWDGFAAQDAPWAAQLRAITPLLDAWEARANAAAPAMSAYQVISHRDMDCKNVLWLENGAPVVIDWEAAGPVNPLQELLDTALAWSCPGEARFDADQFQAFARGYLGGGGVITDDPATALDGAFEGKLGWLSYNIGRSLGTESSTEAERALGTAEVFGAIRSIRFYEELIPRCLAILREVTA